MQNLDNQISVFISYSRSDQVFINKLHQALLYKGLKAYLDCRDIAPGEEWETRLERLILISDAVIFVITDASLKSKNCEWEVQYSSYLGKRIVPLIHGLITEKIPDKLAALNYVYSDAPSFGASAPISATTEAVKQIANAVTVDIKWVREHSKVIIRAEEWAKAEDSRKESLLMRRGEIERARSWVDLRPGASAPKIQDFIFAYLDASEAKEKAERRKLLNSVGVGFVIPVREALKNGHHDYAMRMMAAASIAAEDFEFEHVPEIWQAGARAIYENRLIARFRPYGIDEDSYRSNSAVAIFADGSRVACLDDDRSLTVWDSTSGERLYQWSGLPSRSWGIHFLDERTLIACFEDNTIRILDLEQSICREIFHDDQLNGFSGLQKCRGESGLFIALCRDNTALFVDLSHQSFVKLTGHDDRVTASDYSSTTELIATSSEDYTIKLWQRDGFLVRELKGHEDEVHSICFDPGGQKLISGSGGQWETTDRSVRLWNVDPLSPNFGQEIAQLGEHDYRVNCVGFSPNEQIAASASNDRTVKLWNTDSGAIISTLRLELNRVTHLEFSPDGSRIVIGGDLGRMALIDPSDGVLIARLDRHDHSLRPSPENLQFSEDGTRIVSSSLDNSISVWDARYSDCLRVDRTNKGPGMHSFIPKEKKDGKGQRAAVSHRNNTASVYVTECPTEVVLLRDERYGIEDIGFCDSSDIFEPQIDLTNYEISNYEIVWTQGRSGFGGIALWDILKLDAFLVPPVITLVAALSHGIGSLAGNEQKGLLFRNMPEDLYLALVEKLEPNYRDIIALVAIKLREKFHPGCYKYPQSINSVDDRMTK